MKIKREQARFHIQNLFRLREGYIEFRPIRGSEVRRKFFKNPCNPEQPLDYLNKLNGKWNIYMGVNLRSSRKSKERFLKSVTTFFADVDSKDFAGGREEAKKVIDNFPITPSMLIDSGSGWHCYWVLNKPFHIHHRGDIQQAKQVSAKLHREINADQTYDLSRILRLAGSQNVKDPDNPKLCKFDSISFQTYRFEQLKEVLPDKDLELNQQENLDLTLESDIDCMNDLTTRLPNAIMERAEIRPEKFKSDRSANDYWVAVKLFEQGLNDKEVKDAFKLFAKHDYDAGAKYKETGEQYLNKTISSAKAEYSKKNQAVNNIDSIEIID